MRPFRRAFIRFRDDPSSVRHATMALIATIVGLVAVGALFMWAFDRENYPTYASALWFTLQTVTTVGYGDNPPTTGIGQIVASVVMLVSIGLFTVVTAAVTSLFIQAVGSERQQADQEATTDALARIEAALVSTQERLARLEAGGDAARSSARPSTGRSAPGSSES